MEQFIIMSDLDGTLLNSDSRLTKKTIKYINKLEKMGHYFVIATGRPYIAAKKFINEIKPRIAVCGNGGTIHFLNENRVVEFRFKKELFLSIIDHLKKYYVASFSEDLDNLCLDNEVIIPNWYKHIDNTRTILKGSMRDILNHDPINPTIYIFKEGLNEALKLLKRPEYSDVIGYRYWESSLHYGIEFFPKNATKGGALKYLHEKLNIDINNSLAFGDERNDIELIEASAHGTAMINGKDDLKLHAKHITKYDNDHNGVVRFIKAFLKKQK